MSKERTPARKGTFTISMILGLLLIPLSAVAAIALVDRSAPDIDASASAVAEPISVVTPAVVATTVAGSYTNADLALACGDDGWALVEKEAGGTINDLEQAALDALRPICEGAGMPLAGPPAPAPIVRTVRVAKPAPAPASVTDNTAPAVEPVDAAVDLDDADENDEAESSAEGSEAQGGHEADDDHDEGHEDHDDHDDEEDEEDEEDDHEEDEDDEEDER